MAHDMILLWSDIPRVITGMDILGRLLRGIARDADPGILAVESGEAETAFRGIASRKALTGDRTPIRRQASARSLATISSANANGTAW